MVQGAKNGRGVGVCAKLKTPESGQRPAEAGAGECQGLGAKEEGELTAAGRGRGQFQDVSSSQTETRRAVLFSLEV